MDKIPMIPCIGLTPALQRTLIFERLELDAVNRATAVREGASGKSINVARVLSALGKEAVAGGLIGGETGARIRQDLDAAGIHHDFVKTALPTRICSTLVDRSAATATELVEEANGVSMRDCDQVLNKLKSQLDKASMLVLSGSLPPGAPMDFYARCVKPAEAAGVRTILDARGEPLRQALNERPFVVKLNQAELADTLGLGLAEKPQRIEAMRTIVQRGARWIVVTLGAQGAMLSDGTRVWRLRAPSLTAVNPIGSGDAFAAGLAAALSDGRDVPEACRLAGACAAANALTDQAGHIQPFRLPPLLRSIHLEPL